MLKTIIATQLDNTVWQLGQPLPHMGRVEDENGVRLSKIGAVPNSLISNILLMGDAVEIFAQVQGEARQHHVTLYKPSVAILTSIANEIDWQAAIDEFDDREKIEEVIDLNVNVWKLNDHVPASEDYLITFIGMADDDSVEIFARPKAGTAAAAQSLFFHFRLMPLYPQLAVARAPTATWLEVQKEIIADIAAAEAAAADDNPDDLDDDPNDTDDAPDDPRLDPDATLEPAGDLAEPRASAPINGAVASSS